MRSCEWIRICERMKIGVKNMEAAAERMGRITMIDGPVVRASGLSRFAMGEMTEVGELALMGEILQMDGDSGVVQVYEDTTGLRVGEPVGLAGLFPCAWDRGWWGISSTGSGVLWTASWRRRAASWAGARSSTRSTCPVRGR